MSEKGESLDDLLLSLNLLRTKSQASFEFKDFIALKNESIALDRRFADWQESRVAEFNPTLAGHVIRSQDESPIAVGCWPGKVDTYFDLYVAGVWNVFRAARLLLTTLIITLSDATKDKGSRASHTHIASDIAEDLIASIPYHLADSLQIFLNEVTADTGITTPGRALGGLLLLHPLYVASRVPFLPKYMREYAQRCLTWIGSNMGLGQADLLAKVREPPSGSFTYLSKLIAYPLWPLGSKY